MTEENVNVDGPISEPTVEWEYRNFLCRVYRLGDIEVVGYVKVGDEWTNVVQTDSMTSDVVNTVENEVDRMIRKALSDDDDGGWKPYNPLDDFDPNPGIGPYDPGPDPLDPDDPINPNGPIWMGVDWGTTTSDIIDSVSSGVDSITIDEDGNITSN